MAASKHPPDSESPTEVSTKSSSNGSSDITLATQLILKSGAAELSPAQAEFNRLVQALADCRDRFTRWEFAGQQCLQVFTRQIAPLRQSALARQRALVRGLDQAVEKDGWSRADTRALLRAVCELAHPLVAATGDAEIKAIYNRHSSTDYDEAVRAEAVAFKTMLTEVYGLDMAQARADTRDDLLDHAHAQIAREQERTDARRARRKQRQGGNSGGEAEQAKADAREQRAQATQQSLREVYRKLASALHPDRESDPVQRERKTALMARVNQAYDKRELLTLLGLQLELAQIDAAQLTAQATERLRQYNGLLQAQLAEALRALAQEEQSVREQLRHAVDKPLRPEDVPALLQAKLRAAQENLAQIEDGCAALADAPRLRAWLKRRPAA